VSDDRSRPFRHAHPLRYATLAGALAWVLTTVRDLILFDRPLGAAVKTGLRSGLTWFGVLLIVVLVARRRRDTP